MIYNFKEENFIVLEFEKYKTTAHLGTNEINQLPSIVVRSLAYKAKPSLEEKNVQGADAKESIVVGSKSSKPIEKSNQGATIKSSALNANQAGKKTSNSLENPKKANDEEKIEVASTVSTENDGLNKTENSATLGESLSAFTNSSKEKPIDNDDDKSDLPEPSDNSDANIIKLEGDIYLFGDSLGQGLSGSDQEAIDIFNGEHVYDWDIFRQFCHHIIRKILQVSILKNQSPVLLCIPHSWKKSERENLAQMFFEEFNVPAMLILDRPLASLYGNGAITGLSIDISYDSTTIVPIIDSQVQVNSSRTINIGGFDMANYLASLVKDRDPELYDAINQVGDIKEFCLLAVESGVCGFKLDQNTILPEPETTTLEKIQIEYKGEKYKLGSERLMCCEVFFDGSLVGENDSFRFVDAVLASVLSNEPDKRPSLWESIHLVGKFSNLTNFPQVLEKYLESHALGRSEHFSEFQSRECKVMRIPEYFYGWRTSHHIATFLGAMIIAKVALNDPKYHITKIDYNELGPSVVHTKQFA